MDTPTYQRECLFRHPEFRRDVLAFYQRFPRIFRLWPRVPTHPQLDRFSPAVQPLIQVKTRRVLILIPRTLEDVFVLLGNGSMALQDAYTMSDYQPLRPEWDADYFQRLGTGETRDTYQNALSSLLYRWPTVPRNVLRWGRVDREVRPSVVNKPVIWSVGIHREWLAELTRLADAREVRGFIPIYEGTTVEEVCTALRQSEAQEARRADLLRKRSPKQRRRPDQYDSRLQVWDAYQNCGSFAEIARTLWRPTSTVKAIYTQVAHDIHGHDRSQPRTRKSRLLEGFDPATHFQRCRVCQQADAEKGFCLQCRTYLNQDVRPQRERPASDWLSTL